MRLIRSFLVLCILCGSAASAQTRPDSGTTRGATDVGVARGVSASTARVPVGRRAAVFPDAWRFNSGSDAVFGAHARVASDAPLASQAGVEILKQGGNAVDAAVAVGFALAVAYPEAGNVGGGGYMGIHMADGRSGALDYREIAPLAATRNMYLDSTGTLTQASVVGPLASGVPGAVAGLTAALTKYGTMPLARVMAPAIRYAEHGVVVDSAMASSLRGSRALIAKFAGASLFVPDGAPLPVGATIRQPQLARTLR